MIRVPWKQKALRKRSAFLYPPRGQCGRLFLCLGGRQDWILFRLRRFPRFCLLCFCRTLSFPLCVSVAVTVSPHFASTSLFLAPSSPRSPARGQPPPSEVWAPREERAVRPREAGAPVVTPFFHPAGAAGTRRRNRIHPHAVLQRPLIPLAHLKC